MEYTIVHLDREIEICGMKTDKLNLASDAQQQQIGNAWKNYFELGLPQTGSLYGIYTDYDQSMNYRLIIGSALSQSSACHDSMVRFSIPAGSYAKFIVKGHMPEAVQQFWKDLWMNQANFPFKRVFTADFEVYGERFMSPVPEIDVYIAIQ